LVKPSAISKFRLLGRDDTLETRAWVLPAKSATAATDRVFVIIHGVGLSHRVYGRLSAHLSWHGTVVGVDLPGFGGIRRPSSPLSVHELAQCVDRTLVDLNVRSSVAIGHSMGAQIAVEYALIAPQRVDAVVLIGPVVNPRRHSLPQQMLALVRDSAFEPLATNLMVVRDYILCGVSWYLTEAREMIRYRTDLRSTLLTVPLLAIRGQNDVIAPAEWCEWLAGQDAANAAASIPGHRHVVAHSAPRPTADLIAQFVSKLPPRDVS
jgi:pimeloyl-ACP methyl ester carboxylesterase